MKKIILALLTVMMALAPGLPANAESALLNGQKHYYTVQLRSDKQAIVYARIIFENGSADKELSSYEFSLPNGVSAQNLSSQQILAKSTGEKVCKTYETIEQWRARLSKAPVGSSAPVIPSDSLYNSSKQCMEWTPETKYDENFDYNTNSTSSTAYYSYSYYQQRDSKFDYVDLSQTNNGATYTVTLSEPVKPKKQGSILVSFTTRDFISGGFLGRYDYNVRTLLAKQMVDKATVAVNFDNDMFTREAQQQRTYESSSSSTSLKNGVSAANGADAYQSRSMDSLIGGIGRGGLYVKTQSSLLPGDTLSVKGIFATNQAIMYSTEFLLSLLLLALIVAAAFVYHRWRKKHPRPIKPATANNSEGSQPTATVPVIGGLFQKISAANSTTPWRSIVLASVISIIATVVLTLAVGSVIEGMSSGSSSDGSKMMLQIFGIFAIGILAGLVAPTLYMLRFGVQNAFRWVLVHLVIIVTLLLIFTSLNAPNRVYGGSSPCPVGSNCIVD